MTADQFKEWLGAMKAAGHIRFKGQAAELLGVSREAIRLFEKNGTGGDMMIRTDLACAALMRDLPPWPE